MHPRTTLVGLLAWLGGCTASPQRIPAPEDGGQPAADATPIGQPDGGPEDGGQPGRPRITHAFGALELDPYEDRPGLCAQWTLQNEHPLYVNDIALSNLGGFHHSNWFVVPEDAFEGPDGYFDCDSRNFDELSAAARGTVLFAQSTQSFIEHQRLAPGAVIKLPVGAKIVGGLHTLNLSPRPARSELWMTLEPIHPSEVTAVLSAISIQYRDLELPPRAESRFTTSCSFSAPHRLASGDPFWLRVHYVLPHYHYLGNFFELQVVGGPHDQEVLYTLESFNGEPNGLTFVPPRELAGATGLRMTCGFNNWKDVPVRWGNGDGEMCVVLVLVETGAVLGGTVPFGSRSQGVVDGIERFEGPCVEAGVPKREDQGPPSAEEKAAPLYLPPLDPADRDLPVEPRCEDFDPAVPAEAPATLGSIRETIFEPACTFSACHGLSGAAGLSLTGPDLRARLLAHRPRSNSGMPLVKPGDPEQSWLFHKIARCTPRDAAGAPVSHMPLNAPVLLDHALIAKLGSWIAAGAIDD